MGDGALDSPLVARTARKAESRAARLTPFAFAALFLVTAASCGASIQAVYEGDVRFEHCMALDMRPETDPTLRKSCWDEWLTFYTFGQTLDRVQYAHARQKQLAGKGALDEDEWLQAKPRGPSAVPDPTSALAPPPMMLVVDAGAGDAAEAGADAAEDRAPPAAACAAECEQAFHFCGQDCKAAPCEKACATKYKRCMRRCF